MPTNAASELHLMSHSSRRFQEDSDRLIRVGTTESYDGSRKASLAAANQLSNREINKKSTSSFFRGLWGGGGNSSS